MLEQQLGISPGIVDRDDADAGTDEDPVPLDLAHPPGRGDDATREVFGAVRLANGSPQHRKLVPAEPRDAIVLADEPLDVVRDGLQEQVADRVAEPVVDGFEPAEVDEQDRDGPLSRVRARQRGFV